MSPATSWNIDAINTTTRENFMGLHPVLAVIIGILAMLGFFLLIALIVLALGDYVWIFQALMWLGAGGVMGWILLGRD